MHVDAGHRDALALEQLLQLEAERERAQQLPLVLRHAHVRDRHRRVVAVGDAVDAEGDAEVARAGAVAGVLAERTLLDLVVGQDLALEDDLGVGRHLEVVGLALDQPDRLAGEHAGELGLGDRRRRAGRHRGQRRQADRGGEGTGLAARQVVLGERLAEVGEREHGARHRARVEHHLAVHAPVHVAAHRVLRDHGVPGADVAAAVAVVHQRHRQAAQVDVLAAQNVLLARRRVAADDDRRDGLAVGALDVLAAQFGQRRLRIEPHRDRHAAIGRQRRAEVAKAGVVLDAFHQRRRRRQFADAAHDRAGLVFPVDLLRDAHGVAGGDAGIDEFAVAAGWGGHLA